MLYIYSIFTFLFFLFLLKFISPKVSLIDKPNHRKKHIGEIPLIGGLVIYLNIFLFSFFIDISTHMYTILLTSIILVLLGALDDAIEIGVIFRLITQLICCLIVIGSGLVINKIGNYMYLPNIEIGFLSIVFTVFCVIGLTNSFNFIDGVDGLCSSLALVAVLSVLVISNLNNKILFFFDYKFLLILSLSIFIFVIFNLSKSFKIFLGDSGSMFLGFTVSWILILTSQNENQIIHPVLTIWCVTLPVFDITSVVIRRILRGINPFKPDRRHVHHILIELGFGQVQTTMIIVVFAVIMNSFGILIYYLSGPFPALVSFILLLFLYVILMINLSRKAKSY